MTINITGNDPCEPFLRDAERNVLDVHHRTFAVWTRTPADRLWAILTAHDKLIWSRFMEQGRSAVPALGLVHDSKLLEEGLNYALRWTFEDSKSSFPQPSADKELLEQGEELLLHCGNYFLLSDLHKMYGMGLMALDCSPDERRIRFVPKSSSNVRSWHVMAEVASAEAASRNKHRLAAEAFSRKCRSIRHRLIRGRVTLDDPIDLVRTELFDDAAGLQTETVGLNEKLRIGEFTVAEFRKTWQLLLAWSMAAIQIYLQRAASGEEHATCMPTQVVTRSRVLTTIETAAGISATVANNLIDFLTYDPGDVRCDVFLQPLIASSDSEMLAWSAHAVQVSRSERNLLKRLSSDPSRANLGAELIGGRQHDLLRDLGRLFAKRGGADFKLDKIVTGLGRKANIDLLVYWRRHPDEILLVEAKAILAIDSFHEQVRASNELTSAQAQLRRAEAVLMETQLESRLALFPFVDWAKVSRVFKVIVTPDSPAGVTFEPGDIPAMTLQTARAHLHNRDFQSAAAVWRAARERRWLESVHEIAQDFRTISIGDVVYEVPVSTIEQ